MEETVGKCDKGHVIRVTSQWATGNSSEFYCICHPSYAGRGQEAYFILQTIGLRADVGMSWHNAWEIDWNLDLKLQFLEKLLYSSVFLPKPNVK